MDDASERPLDPLCLAIRSCQISSVMKLIEEDNMDPSRREQGQYFNNTPLPLHWAMYATAEHGKSGYEVFKYLLNHNARFDLRVKLQFLKCPNGIDGDSLGSGFKTSDQDLKTNVCEYGLHILSNVKYTTVYQGDGYVERAIKRLQAPRGPLVLKEYVPKASVDRYENLLNAPFADFFFEIDGERIPAHKCVLANASDYFAAMLEENAGNANNNSSSSSSSSGGGSLKRQRTSRTTRKDGGKGMRESQTNTITPKGDGITADDIRVFLRYLYCGRINNDIFEDRVEQLIGLAEQYDVVDLKNMCECAMCESVVVEEVIPYLQLATLYRSNKLKKRCHTIIKANAAKLMVTKEFMALSNQAPMIWAELTEALTSD